MSKIPNTKIETSRAVERLPYKREALSSNTCSIHTKIIINKKDGMGPGSEFSARLHD
jgi:hypothetical protein